MIRLRARRAAYNRLLRQLHEPWGLGRAQRFMWSFLDLGEAWPVYARVLGSIGRGWQRCVERKAALQ